MTSCSSAATRPPISTIPALGRSSPATMLSSVDLPLPEDETVGVEVEAWRTALLRSGATAEIRIGGAGPHQIALRPATHQHHAHVALHESRQIHGPSLRRDVRVHPVGEFAKL